MRDLLCRTVFKRIERCQFNGLMCGIKVSSVQQRFRKVYGIQSNFCNLAIIALSLLKRKF